MSNEERAQRAKAAVERIDIELRAHGLPSYTELVRELGQALKTLDNMIDRLGKGDKHLYAAVAREYHSDAVNKVGTGTVTHIG